MFTSQYARSVYFVDVENIAGSVAPFSSQIKKVWEEVKATTEFQEGDIVIVGASSEATLFEAFNALPSARQLFRDGKDGADLALIEAIKDELGNVCSKSGRLRFDRLVLVSGDGIFADHIARAPRFGIKTAVCAPMNGFARTLRLAAQESWELDTSQYEVSSARIIADARGHFRLVV